MMSVRQIAVITLNKFYSSSLPKTSANKLLNDALLSCQVGALDRALLTELVYGVIRWQIQIDFILQHFLSRSVTSLPLTVANILRISIYQLKFLSKIPKYAVVNESVQLVWKNKFGRLRPLVNAVLRNFLRNKEQILPNEDNIEALSILYSHPEWMVTRLCKQYGKQECIEILNYNNKQISPTLLINTNLTTIDKVTELLNDNKSKYKKNKIVENCLNVLKVDKCVYRMISKGLVNIQGVSSMLCSALAKPIPNALIFDLCAAPGGKSIYIALNNPNTTIIANDIYPNKVEIIKENIKRMQLPNIQCSCINALEFNYFEKADTVLLDCPCSGFGNINKHPDIKYLRKENDFNDLINLQRKLLIKATKLVKNGGNIIYSTCSIDREENSENIRWFLANNSDFVLENAENYIDNMEFIVDGALQCFQHKHHKYEMDGAFAARLKKK